MPPNGKQSTGRCTEDNDFEHRHNCINRVFTSQQRRYDGGIAKHGNTRQNGYADEINEISVLEHTQPGPPVSKTEHTGHDADQDKQGQS